MLKAVQVDLAIRQRPIGRHVVGEVDQLEVDALFGQLLEDRLHVRDRKARPPPSLLPLAQLVGDGGSARTTSGVRAMGQQDANDLRALLAMAPLELGLAHMGGGAARGVGQRSLEVRTVVEKRVVPGARVVVGIAVVHGAATLHQRQQLAIRHVDGIRVKLVDEDGAHVGLKVDAGKVMGEGSDARRRRGTDARQGEEVRIRARHLASPRGDHARRLPERERTPVVAHALPLLQHVGRVRRGKCIRGGEELHPALPAAIHTRDLGLLEHDLRDPDLVWVTGPAPREVAVELGAACEHKTPERLERRVLSHAGLPGAGHVARRLGGVGQAEVAALVQHGMLVLTDNLVEGNGVEVVT